MSGSPRGVRPTSEIYTEPGTEWFVRLLGTHLHPGGEAATVALAERAAQHGFAEGGVVLELASALGGPARFLARRFAATVVCVDQSRPMHAALARAARAEALARSCLPVLARAQKLPLAAACCDAAWSQDALCHMDARAVLAEVARVLRPGAVLAFTDFIALAGLTREDAARLAREWGMPGLLRLARYAALLDELGFELLVAEDRTRAVLAQGPRAGARDQQAWEADFAARHGEAERARQRVMVEGLLAPFLAGRAGYGLFVCRRRG